MSDDWEDIEDENLALWEESMYEDLCELEEDELFDDEDYYLEDDDGEELNFNE